MSKIYSVKQAADILGISASRLRRMCNRNEVASIRTSGGHRRIPEESLSAIRTKVQGASLPQPENIILVVDDNSTVRRAYQLGLKQVRVPTDIHCVDTGLSAIVQATKLKPSLLIIDLEMGPMGFDGLHVIRAVTDSHFYEDLTIIAVTGLSREVIESRGGLPSSVFVFHKPIDWSRLKGFIEGMFFNQ